MATQTSDTKPAENSLEVEEWCDLQPIEKKLAYTSFTLGIALLVVFIFAFGVFH
jgi:hypothetical protein